MRFSALAAMSVSVIWFSMFLACSRSPMTAFQRGIVDQCTDQLDGAVGAGAWGAFGNCDTLTLLNARPNQLTEDIFV